MRQLSKKEKKTWIAISGTMASGKSSVLAYLAQKGYPVYDCDQINAQLQKKGQVGYQRIVMCFGSEILNEQNEIDKPKLAAIIFSDPMKKKQLEAIMHPLILQELEQIKKNVTTCAFVEVPLLYELGWQIYFDEDWLVIADEHFLIERCKENRLMDEKKIKERLNAQMPSELKRKMASVVIENNEDLAHLYEQIDARL